jgi:hypothetical protein
VKYLGILQISRSLKDIVRNSLNKDAKQMTHIVWIG